MKRRFLAPEVIQTSAMDCGPAALKCMLEGFGIQASYGRLREACQTDVDGTSIDTMEDVARQLGLDAEQVMLPHDHVMLPESDVFPCLVVVRLPSDVTHFIVAWRRVGEWIQVMDPAVGRRWISGERFLNQLYLHEQLVPAHSWHDWARSESALRALERRLVTLGVPAAHPIVTKAARGADWQPIAAVDSAARAIQSMVRSGAIRRGNQAAQIFHRLCEHPERVPAVYFSVREVEADSLVMRGAVLVVSRGRVSGGDRREIPPSLELAAALNEPRTRPGLSLLKFLCSDGLLRPAVLAAALITAASGRMVEAVLFSGLLDLGSELGLPEQRLGAITALLLFLLALLLLELPLASGLLQLGRRLETRLRLAFLRKIPRLGDRYFQSRLKSDLAERCHSIYNIRHLPDLGAQLIRSVSELVLTVVGISWLDPSGMPIAILTALLAVCLPLSLQPAVTERDLRIRSHSGALSRFYLDGLLGLVPILTHGAERSVRREHGRLLVDWARAGLGLQKAIAWLQALEFSMGFGLAAWLIFNHMSHSGETGAILLLMYWALNLPVLGQEIAHLAWQYPGHRNITLRLLEPLGAPDLEPEAEPAPGPEPSGPGHRRGVEISMENVVVRAGGHLILEDINLHIAPGSHVAIVGPSGAGKSSLVGLLLGWHRPAAGKIRIDGNSLEGNLEFLRRQTAWVEPAVQLWNRSLLENLQYGTSDGAAMSIAELIDAAELRQVLERLPQGLTTSLGEGGALVSGGEGQRVRLARALFRQGTRLAILDEPFRGLDQGQRSSLLGKVRQLWKGATILCVTHDLSQTLSFDRVLVLEGGRIVEDDNPRLLAERTGSRYRSLIDAEFQVHAGLWSNGTWRKLRLEQGRVIP